MIKGHDKNGPKMGKMWDFDSKSCIFPSRLVEVLIIITSIDNLFVLRKHLARKYPKKKAKKTNKT